VKEISEIKEKKYDIKGRIPEAFNIKESMCVCVWSVLAVKRLIQSGKR
jgi:hypothetical protein